MNSIEPTSTPLVGCAAISTLGSRRSPREDDLLLVAAGERARRRPTAVARAYRTPRADAARGSAVAIGFRSRAASSAAAIAVAARCSRPARTPSTSRGGGGPRGCAPRPRRGLLGFALRDVVPVDDRYAPTPGCRSPAIASTSSRLAVRLDTCEADDLTARAPRARRHGRPQPAIVDHPQVLDLQHRRPGRRGVLVDTQHDFASDHHARQRLARSLRLPGSCRRRPRRSDVMRSAISSTSSQLVGDEDDRLPLRLQRAHDLEELLRLLRRQHRGRLVEDQHARRRGRAPSGSRRAAAGRR